MTLHFADESTLHTHASLLALASPVLRTAIEDCEHTDGIHLEEESSVWCLALNLIHPNGPTLSDEETIDKDICCLLVCIQTSIQVIKCLCLNRSLC